MNKSIWADDDTARFLRLRVKTFYNLDYFEHIVLPLLDIPPSGHVLDVGCGYGGLSLLLARSRPDLQITGVDLEDGVLESATSIALQEGLANLSFQPGDGHQLEYPADQFNAVMCQTVLTHVRDAVTVINEMRRVAQTWGCIHWRRNIPTPAHGQGMITREVLSAMKPGIKSISGSRAYSHKASETWGAGMINWEFKSQPC